MTKQQIIDIQRQVVEDAEELARNPKYVHDQEHPEKTNPIVVAYLVNNEGKTIKSFRSELFDGEHAEKNLFYNKLNGEDHSNDVLFVSLEPCNNGSRITSVSCSEIISKAHIKKVYIGTLDPDYMVRGLGYAYLLSKKIEVEFFEQEFEKRLIKLNKPFFESKLLEDEGYFLFKNLYGDLLDFNCLKKFLILNKIKYDEETILFETYKVLKENKYIYFDVVNSKRTILMSKGSKLVFLKNPNSYCKGAYLSIIDLTGAEKPSKIFNGSLICSFEEILEYIKTIITNVTTKFEGIKMVIREAVMNAILHKNYESFTPIIIKIEKNRVLVSNPVDLSKIDVKSLNDFIMPSNLVNGDYCEIAQKFGCFDCQGNGSNELRKYSNNNKDLVSFKIICDILTLEIKF